MIQTILFVIRQLAMSFNGKNVSFETTTGQSIWVENNTYNVFEIPKKENSGQVEGEYLTLAQNIDFDYWLLADFEYHIVDMKNSHLVEKVSYSPYGIYTISLSKEKSSITKKQTGMSIDYGLSDFPYNFDTIGR